MNRHIFREYDVRGLVDKDLTEEVQKDDSGALITTKDYTYDAFGHRLSMTTTPNGSHHRRLPTATTSMTASRS